MAKDVEDKSRREDVLRKKALKQVDSETGQPLFTPQLIPTELEEAVIAQRKSAIKNEGGIGNYLYKQAQAKESKQQAISSMALEQER